MIYFNIMKKNKTIKILIIVLVVLILTVVILMSPLFMVKKTAVKGNKYYESETVVTELEKYKGQNYWSLLLKNTPFAHLGHFFTFSPYNAEAELKDKLPFLKTADFSYSLDGTLTVSVTERTAGLSIKDGENFILVDEDGYVIDTFPKDETPTAMILEGVETEGYTKGKKLSKNSSVGLSIAMRIMDLMEQVELEGINKINVEDTDEIWMYIEPSLSIKLGTPEEIGVKLATLKEILNSGYNGESDGIIDFSVGKKPIFHSNKSGGN